MDTGSTKKKGIISAYKKQMALADLLKTAKMPDQESGGVSAPALGGGKNTGGLQGLLSSAKIWEENTAEPAQVAQDQTETPQGDITLERPKGFFATAAEAAGNAIKFGLDAFNALRQKQDANAFQVSELFYGKPTFKIDPVTGKRKVSTARLDAYNAAQTPEEKNKIVSEAGQDVPIVKFFQNPTVSKATTGITKATSNLPLKAVARLQSIGNQTYDQAYSAWLAERNDPSNPVWQKLLYGFQDATPQSAIGVALALGVSAATRRPSLGYAASGAFFSALSANEQIQEREKVESAGNIGIDVIGDTLLAGVLGRILGSGKSAISSALKGAGVEGTTEVGQTLLKYTNDYGNATTNEKKREVLEKAKNYVKSGDILLEFGVGALSGLAISGAVQAIDNAIGKKKPLQTKEILSPPPAPPPPPPSSQSIKAEIGNADIVSIRDELGKIERTADLDDRTSTEVIGRLRGTLQDYTDAFGDKTIFVPSDVSSAPLVEVKTATFPDGKVAMSFSANTEKNSILSPYDFTFLFSSQQEATQSAKDAIIAWARTQAEANPQDKGEYDRVIDYTENPRAPISDEALAELQAEQDTEQERIDSAFSELDFIDRAGESANLSRKAANAKVGEIVQYIPADDNARVSGVVVEITKKSVLIKTEGGKTKHIPLTVNISGDLSGVFSDTEKETFTSAEEKVQGLEKELRAVYAATGASSLEGFTKADEMLSEIAVEMELAKAGERIFVPAEVGGGSDVIGVPSTFPKWIPEELRSRELFDKVLGSLEISKITYPAGNKSKQRELYQTILDELDAQLGIDTSGIRGRIMAIYENQPKKDDKGGTTKKDSGSTERGEQAEKGAGVETLQDEAKKYDTRDAFFEAYKRSVPILEDSTDKRSKGEKTFFDIFIEYTQTPEIQKLYEQGKKDDEILAEVWENANQKKTQTERVQEVVKEKPKTIKEVSEETGILEPNVRRILGVGEKEGTFTRVDKGVYILAKDGQDIAFIHTGSAVEALPRLADEGLKADMVFLDIPYDTPAVRGGNRGVKYDLISVDDFRKIVKAVVKIARTDDTPVFHMFSQARSGEKAMQKYNAVLLDEGLKPIARGGYAKLQKDGVNEYRNMRGEIPEPEGILLLSKSGKMPDGKVADDLNFRLVRPRGYQTEKPAELLRSLIEMSTEEGDLVIDPFAGSGVTGAEAIKAGRKAVLIEKKPEVVEGIIKPRIEAAAKERGELHLKGNNTDIGGIKPSGGKTGDIGKPSGYASAVFSADQVMDGGQPEKDAAEVPIVLGQMDAIRPIEMPEIVDIARELMGGQVPQITKLRRGDGGIRLGDFSPKGGGRIRLQAFLFGQKNLPQAAKTLAHEIGHLVDYLPEGTLKRGNLIGRLRSLRKYMAQTFGTTATAFGEEQGAYPEAFRKTIRDRIRRQILQQRNIKFGDFISGKLDPATKSAVNAEIREKSKQAINEAIDGGGYIRNEKIKNELLAVTRWWRPYNPENGGSYAEYRASAPELYADAISVLFNAPKRLRDFAPTFYEAFFNGLDTKPEVRDAYFETQAILSGDRELLIKRRREGVQKMFRDGDYKAIELNNRLAAEREERRKQYWANFKHTMIDKNFRIIDKVKELEKRGEKLNPDENPVFFLEERNYLGGKIKAIFERDFNSVYEAMTENDISWDDFGEALFYSRIVAGDRSDVANPRGITPESAEELLENMRTQYGEEKWEIIQENMQKFRTALKKIAEDAFKAGLYTPELYAQMKENPAYVTFQVLDHIEDGMTSRVYKSLGTLKDITNPADASMLKAITTIRATERNLVAKNTTNFLKEKFDKEIEEAKYQTTVRESSNPLTGEKTKRVSRFPLPPKNRDLELVILFDEGKVRGYYVDPYVAESINNTSIGANAPLIPILRFMNSGLYRPIFITFNLGFQTFNLVRDFTRFYKNIPDMTLLRALKRYRQAGRLARIRAFGLSKEASALDKEAGELLNRLEYEKVLSFTFNDAIKGETQEEKQILKILADTGVREFQPKPREERVPRFARPAVRALDRAGILDVTSGILGIVEKLGNFIETLPKAAGVYEFSDQNDGQWITEEQKSFIRRKIGSPDFLAGGTYKPITNEVFLFSNAIIQGIRSDIEVANDPKTRSGFWYKTAKIAFLPKVLMLAALLGLWGDDEKELMEGVSEYDRANYTIIPFGKDENGKTIYFRLPSDETSRFLSGVFWKILTLGNHEQSAVRDLLDVLSYTGGQIPSISPAIESVSATAQFLAGQNPYDFFRGRNVISDTTFKAGGLPATKSFLGWQFQQAGGGIFYRFYHEPTAPKEQSATEKVFNLPVFGNIAGRFLRVSDYGKIEKLRNIEKRVESEQARETLLERDLINKYVKEAQDKNIRFATKQIEDALVKERYGKMPTEKDDIEDKNRLLKKFRTSLKRGDADAQTIAIIDANTNEAKAQILGSIKEDMSEAEFKKYIAELVADKIISDAVEKKLKSNE